MTLETKSKKIKDMTDREILEVIQSLCRHKRTQIFSEEGHNFIQCLDCAKYFYEEDI